MRGRHTGNLPALRAEPSARTLAALAIGAAAAFALGAPAAPAATVPSPPPGSATPPPTSAATPDAVNPGSPQPSAATTERLIIDEAHDPRHQEAVISLIDGRPATAELWYDILRDADRPDSPESPEGRILTLSSGEEIALMFGSRLYAREIWQDGPEGPQMTLHTRWEHLPNIRIRIEPAGDAA